MEKKVDKLLVMSTTTTKKLLAKIAGTAWSAYLQMFMILHITVYSTLDWSPVNRNPRLDKKPFTLTFTAMDNVWSSREQWRFELRLPYCEADVLTTKSQSFPKLPKATRQRLHCSDHPHGVLVTKMAGLNDNCCNYPNNTNVF